VDATPHATPRLAASRRRLTDGEKRLIRAKIERLEVSRQRATGVVLPITGAIVLALWIWTLLASDAPRPVITGFWLGVGAVIALWVRRDMGRHAGQLAGMARGLESALSRDAADEYAVRARAFAELEEIADEGACYAFELGGERLVFIVGQEFYPDVGFPSLDFALVYVLDEHDAVVDMLIDRRGAKAPPARVIPAAVKRTLATPEHLAVYPGQLADVEACLGPAPA
jgi:hypothetical protein